MKQRSEFPGFVTGVPVNLNVDDIEVLEVVRFAPAIFALPGCAISAVAEPPNHEVGIGAVVLRYGLQATRSFRARHGRFILPASGH